jgi:hypothetical protein
MGRWWSPAEVWVIPNLRMRFPDRRRLHACHSNSIDQSDSASQRVPQAVFRRSLWLFQVFSNFPHFTRVVPIDQLDQFSLVIPADWVRNQILFRALLIDWWHEQIRGKVFS